MNYWLLKSEPFKYSWDQMLEDKKTFWDGVRSYPARVHLRNMQKGDLGFFYHSNEGVEIVGIVKIIKTAYLDPTIEIGDGDWVAVDVQAVQPVKKAVSLATIKATPELANMQLVKQSRLSVSPVTAIEWEVILKLAETKV